MITIAKTFTFDAAHSLPVCPEGHKCRRLHGHTYEVEIRLFGTPDLAGFVVDYDVIAQAWAPIGEQLDHRQLNDIEWLGSASSTERLVLWVFKQLVADREIGRFISAIKISESSTTYAEMLRADFDRWLADGGAA
ncbi:MAG TPA: 6-carboxytetrahydropterin synthase [Steroidobacteraceae bacterium]|nr:6-carboxytetrahydropterin synthase [Steroidobacteraceae bacterium]